LRRGGYDLNVWSEKYIWTKLDRRECVVNLSASIRSALVGVPTSGTLFWGPSRSGRLRG
jgi:hypothetical protein